MKLIKFLNSIVFCFLCLFLVSCCHLDTRRLTAFPPSGYIVEYEGDPVISYNSEEGTYLVKEELVQNAVQYKIYINEINKWKTDNGIR